MIDKVLKSFNNCKKRDIREFEEVTPQGNKISGYICLKHNRFLGSLVILKINGEDTFQFVQSMPKIKYYQHPSDVDKDGYIIGFEKLDGSCLILYPLFDKDGGIIEIVPKTRGMAVADKSFLELYDKVDKSSIESYYRCNKGILYFELYGILNKHEIIHYDTGIDIALIGCYNNGHFYKAPTIRTLATYGFKLPDELFIIRWHNPVYEPSIKGWKVFFTSNKYRNYDIEHEVFRDTIEGAIKYIQKSLEKLNKQYYEKNGRIATEGIVINCTKVGGLQKYIKVKPKDIEIQHKSRGGIPKQYILKECLKYFDEYGSQVKEIYLKDENHHTEYIHNMLLEEFPIEYIKNSSKKIEKIFMQVWDSRTVPSSIEDICDELIKEYGDDITHCMRMFAQKYPQKKKQSRMVYSYLQDKVKT